MPSITLIVNGAEHKTECASGESLLSVLRHRLRLTGTKYGCGEGQCGACTVLLRGKATRSCLTPAGSVAGQKIVTIEGLEGRLPCYMRGNRCGSFHGQSNPNGLRNQISGAIVQGIGGALFEAIHFDNGRIGNPYFADYRLPRFSDVPQIEVELIDRKDQPSMGRRRDSAHGLGPSSGWRDL
jgi:ferredoxin